MSTSSYPTQVYFLYTSKSIQCLLKLQYRLLLLLLQGLLALEGLLLELFPDLLDHLLKAHQHLSLDLLLQPHQVLLVELGLVVVLPPSLTPLLVKLPDLQGEPLAAST